MAPDADRPVPSTSAPLRTALSPLASPRIPTSRAPHLPEQRVTNQINLLILKTDRYLENIDLPACGPTPQAGGRTVIHSGPPARGDPHPSRLAGPGPAFTAECPHATDAPATCPTSGKALGAAPPRPQRTHTGPHAPSGLRHVPQNDKDSRNAPALSPGSARTPRPSLPGATRTEKTGSAPRRSPGPSIPHSVPRGEERGKVHREREETGRGAGPLAQVGGGSAGPHTWSRAGAGPELGCGGACGRGAGTGGATRSLGPHEARRPWAVGERTGTGSVLGEGRLTWAPGGRPHGTRRPILTP